MKNIETHTFKNIIELCFRLKANIHPHSSFPSVPLVIQAKRKINNVVVEKRFLHCSFVHLVLHH